MSLMEQTSVLGDQSRICASGKPKSYHKKQQTAKTISAPSTCQLTSLLLEFSKECRYKPW